MKKVISFVFLAAILTACSPPKNNWTIVYKNDKEGNLLIGSKEELIDAIRKGASIRIGWGSKGENHSIEHLSEPIWIAVLDEKEVVAHIDPQVLSEINWDDLSATYSDSIKVSQEWRVAITTKGTFDAIWYDRKGHEITRRMPQNHTMSWFVKDVNEKGIAKPLFQ